MIKQLVKAIEYDWLKFRCEKLNGGHSWRYVQKYGQQQCKVCHLVEVAR